MCYPIATLCDFDYNMLSFYYFACVIFLSPLSRVYVCVCFSKAIERILIVSFVLSSRAVVVAFQPY